ncbi:MAG: DNA polymerase III subunit delta [Heliobacteriaceae bacterium]|jgi:DNA polymerase III delta subunit|nr:DNA polymerase III subunit delta [Heliobacteriaceae bacterium]
MTVYFYYGEEDFNIEKEIGKLKSGLDKNFLDMSFKTYSNPKFPDLIAITRSTPMMFGKMLVVIDIAGYFSKGLEDNQIEELEDALKSVSENLDVVLVAALKPDSRKKLFKMLSKHNAKEFPVIPTYKTAELEAWITKQGRSKGLSLKPDALKALVSQIGNNLRQFDAELDKLKLLAHPGDVVTAEMVREICISNEDLFAFSDYLMQNEKDKALLEYRKLLDKKYAMEILSALQTMVRRWITLKSTSTCQGMHEYVAKLTLQKLKNTPLKDLVKLKQNLTDAEFRIKSGLTGDMEKEIENAFLK